MAGSNTPAARPMWHSEHGPASEHGTSGKQGGALENPLIGPLGDPSLNQNYGGGFFGGFMQGRQKVQQHKAFIEQNRQNQERDEQFKQKWADNYKVYGNPEVALMHTLTENPKLLPHNKEGQIDYKEIMASMQAAASKFAAAAPGSTLYDTKSGKPGATIPGRPHVLGPQGQLVDDQGKVIATNPNQRPSSTSAGKQVLTFTGPDGKESYGEYDKNTGSVKPIQAPPGMTAGKPPAPAKWNDKDRLNITALHAINSQLPILEANVGASAGLAGHITGPLTYLGIAGPQSKDFMGAVNELRTQAQALSGLSPRLRAAYQAMEKTIPQITSGESYNKDEVLPQLRWAARQMNAGMYDYLKESNKEIPDSFDQMTRNNHAHPNFMASAEQARATLLSNPGMLTKSQVEFLRKDNDEHRDLPMSAHMKLIRQLQIRGMADPNDVKGWTEQHPEVDLKRTPPDRREIPINPGTTQPQQPQVQPIPTNPTMPQTQPAAQPQQQGGGLGQQPPSQTPGPPTDLVPPTWQQ